MTNDAPEMKSLFGGTPSGGFFDLPILSPDSDDELDIVILGAPSATPYESVGPYCADAPDAIRAAFGWPGVLNHHDFDFGKKLLADHVKAADWGNLDFSKTDYAANRNTITQHVKKILSRNAVPIVMGGDDSIPIPVLNAFHEAGPITILQLDAHIDWRDNVNGVSLGLSSNMRRASEMSWVENIIQVGARGIGSARPQDYEDAVNWGVQFFPMREVQRHGLEQAINAIPENCNLYIALDIDVMDPAVVPAVIGPAPGGFSYWQMLDLLEGVSQRANIVGFNLAELMPSADIGARGALVAARIVAMMIGLIGRQK